LVQLTNVLPQSANELTYLAKAIHGEQNGIYIINVGRLGMENNQKLKFEVFIHNDDMKCFHMVVQRTQKMVVMGYINFKDETLIKRQRKFKNE
jgi:hypothetical protein